MVKRLKSKAQQITTSKLGSNLIALLLLQVFNYLLPLLTVPYLSRVLGAEKLGIIAFVYSVILFFNIFVTYGFHLSVTQAIAKEAVHKNWQKINNLVNAVLLAKIILALIGLLILVSISFFFNAVQEYLSLYFIIYLVVIGNALFPVWFFQGMGQMKYATIINVIAKLIMVVAIFYFVKEENDFFKAAVIQSLSFVFTGVFSWLFINKIFPVKFKLYMPSKQQLINVYKEGWHIFVSSVAINFYTNSTTFILGLMVSPIILGFYSAADKLLKLTQEIMQPISQAVYPHVTELKEKSEKEAIEFIKKFILIQSLLGLVIGIFLFILSDWLVLTLFGAEYQPAAAIVKVMAFLPLIIGLSNIFGIQTMLNFGMKREFSLIILLSALLNISMIVPLSYYYGAVGAASSMLVTECFVTISMFIVLVKKKILTFL